MASQQEIEAHFNLFDDMFRRGIGETGDYTCAFYDGNYDQTLEQAQAAKHNYIFERINFKPGMTVLDVGSGWGPVLKAVEKAGGTGIGLTLSSAQVASCRRNGLDARLKDWKDIKPGDLPKIDAITAVGSIEHYCTQEEYRAGKQDEIYQRFFKFANDLLPAHGRLYVQSFVWGENPPDESKVSVKAPKDSNEYLVELTGKLFPGTWLPQSKEQLETDGKKEGFKLVSTSNGREDYKVTIVEWGKKTRKLGVVLPSLPRFIAKYITDSGFRYAAEGMARGGCYELFERKVMNHWRLTFEKV